MHDTLNFNHRNRVDAGKRFVEQNKTRTSGQGASDFGTTALTARDCWCQVLTNTGDLKFVQKLFKFFLDLFLGERTAVFVGLQLKNGLNIFFDRQRSENTVFLRKVSNSDAGALVNGEVLNRLSVQKNLSSVGCH